MSNSAGIVTKVSGESYVISGENTTPLAVGSSFSAADILVTKVGANLEVKFHDDSLVSLGPSSRIEVKEFIFDAEQQVEPSFVVHMFEGVVRSVSGKVVEQNPEAFKLSSPLATIGIRGTETLHIISPANEMHAVVSLGAGHTVVMGTPDGRSIVISDSLQGLKLALNDFSPLQIINTNPELLDEFIQKIQSEGAVGSVQANPQGVFVFADAEFLNSIASVKITGSVGFLAIEQLGKLVTVLDVENSIAAELVSDVFTDDTLLLSSLEPRSTSSISEQITAEQVVPDPITPNPIVPDPIVPPPLSPPPAGQVTNQVNLMGTLYGDSTGNMTTHGASDTITISGAMQNAGTILSGDAGGNISGAGVIGGNDVISVGNFLGGDLYGDAAGEINTGAKGGSDAITIGSMANSGTAVYGDAHDIKDTSVGGNDSISVTGAMQGGDLYGDALNLHDSSRGGNDTITIGSMSNSGTAVYGDAYSMTGSSVGGNDSINIGPMSSGNVYGDAYSMASGTTAGNDSISIASMSGGNVYGDASILATGITGGNDTITVASMSGGQINGGVGNDLITINSMSAGTVIGDDGKDSITITNMSGGTIYGNSGDDSITISGISGNSINLYGGTGNDIFVFKGSSANSTITIKDFGSASGNTDKIGFGQGWSYVVDGSSSGDWHIIATDGTNNLTVVLEGITSFNSAQLIP